MTLQNWADNGWLRAHKTSPQEIRNLLDIVQRDMKDSKDKGLSADWRFGIAYNAALKLCTILMYGEGFRPEKALAHYRTLRALPLILGAERDDDADYLDRCRTKRNTGGTMRIAATSILFVFCALLTSLHASIQLKIADSAAIHAALGKPPDSLWYCREAYEAIRDGRVSLVNEDSVYWVDSLNSGLSYDGFNQLRDTNVTIPEEKYMVVGVAEDFVVPATGEYTFDVKGDDALFVSIDGMLLTDTAGKVFLYDSVSDNIDPSRGRKGYPHIDSLGLLLGLFGTGHGYSSKIWLDSGSHSFTFYYYENKIISKASLSWLPPDSTDMSIVPSHAFPPRRNYGPFMIQTVGWNDCPFCIYKGECPKVVRIDVEAYSGVAPGEVVEFYWDFQQNSILSDVKIGDVDIITTETYIETTFTCAETKDVIWFEVWGQIGERKSPIAELGQCNALYCFLDECNQTLKQNPEKYEKCEDLPDGHCDSNKYDMAISHPPRLISNLVENNGLNTLFTITGRRVLANNRFHDNHVFPLLSNGIYLKGKIDGAHYSVEQVVPVVQMR